MEKKIEERRKGGDRRKRDLGPPEGWKHDRRRNPERRAIEVEEISPEEFNAWVIPGRTNSAPD